MARLGDYIEQIRGVSYKPEDICSSTDNGAVAVLRANNIQDDGLNFDDLVYIKESKISDKQYIQKGDIVVCASSGSKNLVGKAAIASENFPVAFGAFCKVVRPKKLIPSYIGYFFQSPKYRSTISELSGGANINNIRNEHIDELDIVIVSEKEQESIVNQLDDLSNLISLRKQQLSKFDELVKSRFVELFVDKDFPKTTIGELVASKVSSVKKVILPTDTIKYIDISSIDNKRNIMTGFTEYVLEDAPSRAQQHIRKGDIVVSTVRPNLKNVAITGYDYDNLVASSGFCVLRAEKCLPSYLMAVVCSDDFTDAMTKVVTGANYPAIKDSDVKNYVVPNPPVELQEQFAAFVEQTDKSKLAIQQSLEKLETLKKALMQKYFG